MARDVFVVVNPISAHGRTAVLWPEIRDRLTSAGLEFAWGYAAGPKAAVAMARDAVEQGYTTLVAVGGDGTLNEVVNGIMMRGNGSGPPSAPTDISIGMVSCGTGRDFIRTLRVSRDWRDAAETIARRQPRAVDVGLASFSQPDGSRASRLFVNVADVGLGGQTAVRVNKVSKAWGGFLSYLVGAVSTILTYRNKLVTIRADGTVVWSDRASAVVVANGRFFGGGMMIAPHAVLDDGLFDVVLLGDMTRLELLTNIPRVYNGSHLKHPKVRHFRAAMVELATDQRMILETDGECQEVGSVTFTILPKALSVIA